MKYVFGIIVLYFLCPSIGMTSDISLMSSGKDISLGFWGDSPNSKRIGGYVSLFGDFEDYQNGTNVSLCRDGAISGSFGSGTCSGHSGVSRTKEAEFSRLGLVLGGSIWVSRYLQVHGGLLWAHYSSDIDIGETSVLDYEGFGVDLGFSLRPALSSNFKIVVSHETEQKRTLFGARFNFR